VGAQRPRVQVADLWDLSGANVASRGPLGDSHIFCRHGLRRWWSRI